MINISHLSKTFSGQKVLDDLSLDIQKGEVVALIGSSGAGKSTFLRSLNYLEQPDSGKITIDGFKVDFSRISKDEIFCCLVVSMMVKFYNPYLKTSRFFSRLGRGFHVEKPSLLNR